MLVGHNQLVDSMEEVVRLSNAPGFSECTARCSADSAADCKISLLRRSAALVAIPLHSFSVSALPPRPLKDAVCLVVDFLRGNKVTVVGVRTAAASRAEGPVRTEQRPLEGSPERQRPYTL